MDKTNQRDLRRFLRQQEIFAVNPRVADGRLHLTIAWGDFPPGESMFAAPNVLKLTKATILVLNGTSATGQAALAALREYAHLYHVRASSRGAPTEKLLSAYPHVQWVKSDLSAASLKEVTRGVHKVFYVMPLVENRVEVATNLAEALKQNHVSYVVHVSIAGAQYRSGIFAKHCTR